MALDIAISDPVGNRAATTHPLDPLSGAEIEKAAEVIKASEYATEALRFVMISLEEPPKPATLVFDPLEVPARKAVEPYAEARPNHFVICELARRLGARHSGFEMSEWEIIEESLRLSGLPESLVARYALRNALPPVVTLVAVLYSFLIGGAVLVEVVFGWGGAGQYAVQGVLDADFAVVQGFVLVAAIISLVVYLIVDLVYLAIDPRLTH